MKSPISLPFLVGTVVTLLPLTHLSAQIVESGTGPSAASITPARDAFRLDLGGGTTAGANGSFGGVRREINWDGVPDALSAPNNLPADFFNVNSPRGAVFSTAGTGFQVSGNSGVAPIEFDNINPTYSSIFATFSAQRLFTSLGSNVLDVSFFVPGTTTPALTRGFGSVFTDVDLANTSSIQFFDAANLSLGIFPVPAIEGNETLSFLGVSFATPVISRVRITSGNQALGPNTTGDVVVMDDFIYAEPVAAKVPETAGTVFLFGLALAGMVVLRRFIFATRTV